MSNHVSATIDIDAPPDRVWEVVLDANRLDEWVTIHRKLNRAPEPPVRTGAEMEQTLCLRGANFKVSWEATEVDPPRRVVWHGRGPMRSRAFTTYTLQPNANGGTHFEYENDFHPPGGPLGAAASRIIVGGVPRREAEASLRQLKALIERG